MGALPKRRISTGRKGRRRMGDVRRAKHVKQHAMPLHKRTLVEKLKSVFNFA